MNTQLLGINFYHGTYQKCLAELTQKLKNKKSALVVTPNPEMLHDASRDDELLKILQKADLALPDGAGVFVAYQVIGSNLPRFLKYCMIPCWCARAILHSPSFATQYGERITGSRLTRDLLQQANEKNIPITIIDPVVHGDSEGDKAKRASQSSMKQALEKTYPNTQFTVIISDSVPEILPEYSLILATHGNGKQEKLISKISEKNPNCGIAIGIGGSIDLITGFRSPAPRFFQRFGGEWLYRLYKNPRKHWKRMKKVVNFIL